MSRLLRRVCHELGVALQTYAPGLADIQTVQAPPEHAARYPALAILPQRFRLDPCPDDEVLDEDGNPVMSGATDALMEVAALRGEVRLWLAARSPAERARLEEQITAAFFGDPFAPSRYEITLENVEVLGVASGATCPVAFMLEDSEWREELVFSERRWSFLRVSVDVPVYVWRRDAALVTTMVAALTTDLDTTISSPDDVASPPLADLDQVLVEDDGTVGAAYP